MSLDIKIMKNLKHLYNGNWWWQVWSLQPADGAKTKIKI